MCGDFHPRLGILPGSAELLFDFRLVTGIDSSATHSFAQIKAAADAIGARLVFVGLTAELQRAFRNNLLDENGVLMAANLDSALETCEEAIIALHRPADGDVKSLQAWLAEVLGSKEKAEHLAARCVRLEMEAGEEIARQGDPSDSMHFILEGRVGIFVGTEGGEVVRVRSLGRQTMIGEMGLISGRPRSAAIRAEAKSVLYQLPVEAYRQITRDDPALGQALFKLVIEVMAERLTFANRLIGVLQR